MGVYAYAILVSSDSLVSTPPPVFQLRNALMTGPPTPPPSSATEIEDAARTTLPPPQAVAPASVESAAAPAQPAAEQQQQPPITSQTAQKSSYELLFPSIAELARSGSIRDLIEVAERGDQSVRS